MSFKGDYPSLWFVCKYCRRAYQERSKLVAHKRECHSNELKREKAVHHEKISNGNKTSKVQEEVKLERKVSVKEQHTESNSERKKKPNVAKKSGSGFRNGRQPLRIDGLSKSRSVVGLEESTFSADPKSTPQSTLKVGPRLADERSYKIIHNGAQKASHLSLPQLFKELVSGQAAGINSSTQVTKHNETKNMLASSTSHSVPSVNGFTQTKSVNHTMDCLPPCIIDVSIKMEPSPSQSQVENGTEDILNSFHSQADDDGFKVNYALAKPAPVQQNRVPGVVPGRKKINFTWRTPRVPPSRRIEHSVPKKVHNGYKATPTWMRAGGTSKSVLHCLINREIFMKAGTKVRQESLIFQHLSKQRNNDSWHHKPQKRTKDKHNRRPQSDRGTHRGPVEIISNNRADPRSRSMILESTTPFPRFDVMEDQLYVVMSKPELKMCFFDIQPGLDNATRVALKRKHPAIAEDLIGEDFDIFYIETAPPGNSATTLHNMLVTIPSSQDKLVLYDMEIKLGELVKPTEEFQLSTTIKYHTLNCHPGGQIIVQSLIQPIPGVFREFLIFSYPPLKLEARVQVMEGAMQKGRYQMIETHAEFVTLISTHGKIELCRLDELLDKAMIATTKSSETEKGPAVTHIVKEFTKPFLSSRAEYLVFGLPLVPAYYWIRDRCSYKVFELTHEGSLHVGNNDLLRLEDEDIKDTSAVFMRNTNRTVLVGRNRVRILDIVRDDSATITTLETSKASLATLFDVNFLTDAPDRPANQSGESYTSSGRLRRSKLKSTYSEDAEDFVLCFDDNHFLQQFVVVRVRVDQITCFVYSSKTFELIYMVKSEDFGEEQLFVEDGLWDWEADLSCRFAPDFIAVKYKKRLAEGKDHRMLCVFNLIKPLITELYKASI